ncbi:hypothetical protein GGR26_002766 [Lewinella marina]|uniref:Copper-binding protein MbnP-like domain-containing protein n=1 Tax=Neolewinella marina TaxID=438751 RepID=A0A2G0CCW5_9BACT|nr:MbnP family protein [Neolewinella marina]NJB86989.1 hypothetical protein [Neolewinella marina]PHK97816.1 hypothetical protein CGL56_13455 [Neolewinella marina]
MKNLLLFLLLPLLLTTGCLDDDDQLDPLREGELALAYRAEYGGQPLDIQRKVYGYPTGDSLKVLLFQYYVSDLELLPADGGESIRLEEIDLIRRRSAAGDPTVERTYLVPAGDYRGLRFGLGVKPELNAMNPSKFAANYVLNEAEFWGPTTRYVFAKIEANAMLEDDGRFDTGLSYHMGSDALYTTVTLDRRFTVGSGRTPRLTVVADVLKALSGNGETFDITAPGKQTVHGGNQDVAVGIWNRLATQFALRVE